MAFNWRKFPWTNLHDLNLDWIIQTVKTLEDNLTDAIGKFTEIVNTAISKTLTGSGDLTINKTGDVNISGAHVKLSNTYISAGSEQLTLYNPNSKTSMGANYNSGVLTMSNNQDLSAGVALYPIRTPEIVDGDDSDFAANVGYVKTAVAAVDGKLDTEINNRTSGDTALRSSIDLNFTLITQLQKRAPRVFYFENDTTTNTTQFMTAEDTAALKAALLDHTPVMLIAKTQGTQYCYLPVNCSPVPTADNIEDPNTDFTYTFQSANNLYRAMVSYSNNGQPSTAVFQTIS